MKRASPKKRQRKAKPGTKGLGPAECQLIEPSGIAADIVVAIQKVGGCVVGSYKDPLGGYPILIVILPIDAVEPTPMAWVLASILSIPQCCNVLDWRRYEGVPGAFAAGAPVGRVFCRTHPRLRCAS
jgi:hypothetical protein